MFPESYVKTLRDESANYRIQARDAAEQTRAAVLGEVAAQLAAKDAEINRLTAEVGDGWILQEAEPEHRRGRPCGQAGWLRSGTPRCGYRVHQGVG
jgi:hypothetical protein